MKTEFVPYEPSLRLKALGFDEPCFATWSEETLDMSLQIPSDDYFTKAPTFSQAFRFFREKYELHHEIRSFTAKYFTIIIQERKDIVKYIEHGGIDLKFKTYEEAELACLIRLIEIVEKEQENDK